MSDTRRLPHLREKPCVIHRGREIGVKHLDRDGSIAPQGACPVDRGPAASADLTLNQIAIGGSRLERGKTGIGHSALRARNERIVETAFKCSGLEVPSW